MQSFLFATDFSKANMNAFEYAKSLIHGHDIVLDIVHVYDAPFAYTTETPARALKGYLEELRNAANERMTKMMSELPSSNQGKIHIIHGIYASEEIHECAEAIKPELVILSLREDYGLFKRFIGNTTARIIHKTSLPVLAIPAHAKYEKIENVVFPTAMSVDVDLSEREIKAIKWLSKFSGFLNHPDIELLHILDDEELSSGDVTLMGRPFNDMKLTYSHAYTVEEGIMQYTKKLALSKLPNKKPNLIAFYKPHRSFWERLYHPSRTRNLLYDSNIPLMVFG